MRSLAQILFLLILVSVSVSAQQVPFNADALQSPADDSLSGFNTDSILLLAKRNHLTANETSRFIERSKRIYIANRYNLPHPYIRSSASSVVRSAAMPACTNIDFETGDFTGWTGSIGDNYYSGTTLTNVVSGIYSTTINAAESDCNARHTIMQAPAGVDSYGGFPIVPANAGQYTVRLGNNCSNYMGETLEQTFAVDASNTDFTLRYAIVLNDGGHLSIEQPYFKVDLLDSVGNEVSPCVTYYEAITSSSDGYLLSPVDPNVYYYPWTTITLDLQAYVGQNLTIRFTVAGCAQGGHFGYAYVDCFCGSIADVVSARFCPGSPGAVLIASSGFAGYQWFDPNGNPIPNSDNDTLFVNNAQNGDTFTVEMKAVADTSCLTNLSVVVEVTNPESNITTIDPSCYGLTDGSATVDCFTCIPPVQYNWNTTPAQTSATINNLGAGTYIVSYVDSIGCTSRDTARLFDPGQHDTAGITTQFCVGDLQITLTALSGQPGYQWYRDSVLIPGATAQSYIVTSPQTGDVYIVEYATSPCTIYDTILLNYTPPVNLFSPDSLVNVFTPNGDARNDFFYPYYDASVAGQTGGTSQPAYDFSQLYIGTYEIRVYDRWGVELFYSNDYNVGWDGTNNGKKASDGIYYWIANYTTRCKPDAEVQSQRGFVHLMR
jgi:hypothetical protein